jgi:hypothetical protein
MLGFWFYVWIQVTHYCIRTNVGFSIARTDMQNGVNLLWYRDVLGNNISTSLFVSGQPNNYALVLTNKQILAYQNIWLMQTINLISILKQTIKYPLATLLICHSFTIKCSETQFTV